MSASVTLNSVEPPEISELEEVAHLSGGRVKSLNREDSAELFSP